MGYLVSAVIMILMIPVFIGGYFYTEATFEKFGEELTEIQTPENTNILDSVTEFGTVIGNGDHCDYLAGMIFETSDDKDSVESYFQSQYTGKSEIEFIWLDEESEYTNSDYPFLGYASLRNLANENSSDLLRGIVYIFKPEATFDIRCM